LDDGKIALAIDAYDKALACRVAQQEGPILLMRATAYSQRAAQHKQKLQEAVGELAKLVPDSDNLHNLFQEAKLRSLPSSVLSRSIFRRILQENLLQENQLRKAQYRHGLYQYALLAAAQDSLRATELLPNYAVSWLKAGEILSELWKLKESQQYFEKAVELDKTLATTVAPVIERLGKRQELLENARSYGSWADSTLRLALDATG
jgi:tetratricopeptide (TPR) repeat protein